MKKFAAIFGLMLLYFVATVVCACLGFLHPFLWVYSALPCAILGAWPYCKLLEKYPLPGMAVLTTVVFVALHLLMGEGDLLLVGLAAVIGIVAEGVRRVSGYEASKGRMLSYMVISLLPLANTLRMWLKPEQSMQITVDEMGESYAEQMQGVLEVWLLVVMVILTVALACFMFKVLNRKHEADANPA